MDDNIIKLKTLLQDKKKIVIIPHSNPDGDAMGSSLGLSHYLGLKGHDMTVITPTNYPEFLKWLPGDDKVVRYWKEDEPAKNLILNAELIFCLDFNALSRIGKLEPFVNESKAIKIVIDHHIAPDDFPDILISEVTASSTCELIYKLICDLGDKNLINLDIASCIYTGILTDTGGFQFPSTSADVHRIAAHLFEIGVDHTYIYQQVFNSFSESRLRLFGFSITEKLKVFDRYKTAIISLNREDLKRFNIKTGDTEGLVNFPLKMKEINFAVLIIDRTERIKFSFRSKGSFDVNKFARKYFNGGGHKNAAGGMSKETLEDVVKKFEEVLPAYEKDLNY